MKQKKTANQITYTQYKGCRGRRLKIELLKEEFDLGQDSSTTGVGLVVGAGPEATCKVGDKIIFTYWAKDKVTIDDKELIYILDTDTFVCEIL